MTKRTAGGVQLKNRFLGGMLLAGLGAVGSQALAAETGAAAGFAMNEEVRTAVRAIRGLALAPDGKHVVAGITETTAEGGLPHLWLLAPNASPRQLTFRTGERGETDAGFAPDGGVVFLATQAGTRSLFRLPTAGGEPERLQIGKEGQEVVARWGGAELKAALAVAGFAYSPDGRYMALWADDPEPAATKARRDRKDDGYSHHDDEPKRTHLYLLDPQTGAARAVKLDGEFASASWSRDSIDLVVTTDPRSDLTGPNAAFWQVRPDTLAATRIQLPSTAGGVTFLPGRSRLVYTDTCGDFAPPRCNDLFVKDLNTGATRNLTAGFDGDIPSSYNVLPDGDLLMSVPTHFRTRLARLSTRTGAITWYDVGQPVASSLVTNAKQAGWAFLASSATLPTSAMLLTKLGGTPVPLVAPPLTPARWPKVPSHIVSWQNEGLTIEGALYMPVVAPGTKVPLVVNIHGGPAGRFQDDHSAQIQMLVAEGWAVLQPNIRGSTGYGAKFLGANRNDLGGADYRDVMAGVDAVLRDYPLDPDRMALIGYSYGGEMAGFVVGRTNRFKAIVSGAPVINQFSEYGTERGTFYDRWYYGKPWLHFEDAWRQSPLSTAAKAKTPFLLLQGEKDVTDPLGQSLEMYTALRQSDVPVALVIYPREGHPETGGNFRGLPSQEPWHGLDLRRRMFGFLRAAFAGEPDPLAAARKDIP